MGVKDYGTISNFSIQTFNEIELVQGEYSNEN